MNEVKIEGRIGTDPEVRYTGSGKAVANLRLAHDGRKGVEWFTVTAWDDLAEKIADRRKGEVVRVEGRLTQREWTDREGGKRSVVEIVATSVTAAGASAPRKRDGTELQTSDGAVFPAYGRAKGRPIAGASADDLAYYAAGCQRTLDDPGKARWHAKERALLDVIEAEQRRQKDGGPPPGCHCDIGFCPVHEAPNKPSAAPSEDDIPF